MTDTLLAWKRKLDKLVLHNYRIQLLEEGWRDNLDDGGDGDDDNSGILAPLETRNPHNIHYSRLKNCNNSINSLANPWFLCVSI